MEIVIHLHLREDKELCFEKKSEKRRKMKDLKTTEDEIDKILEDLKPLEEELIKVDRINN